MSTTPSSDFDLPPAPVHVHHGKGNGGSGGTGSSIKNASSRQKNGSGRSSRHRKLDPMEILWGDPFDPAKVLQIPPGPNPNGERYVPPCYRSPPSCACQTAPQLIRPPPYSPAFLSCDQQIIYAQPKRSPQSCCNNCCNNCYFYPAPSNNSNCATPPFPFSAIMKSMPPFRARTSGSGSSSCENLF